MPWKQILDDEDYSLTVNLPLFSDKSQISHSSVARNVYPLHALMKIFQKRYVADISYVGPQFYHIFRFLWSATDRALGIRRFKDWNKYRKEESRIPEELKKKVVYSCASCRGSDMRLFMYTV